MALLHEDLVAIRKNRQLKQSDIFEKTRIPLNIVDEIERGTIFTNKSHQLTYIRSYVRSYAKAVGIKEEHIVQALDEYQSESYSGKLRTEYMTEPETGTAAATSSTSDTPEQTKPAENAEKGSPNVAKTSSGSTLTKGGNEYSRPDPHRDYNQTTPPPPDMGAVDWAGVGKKVSNSNNNAAVYAGLIAAVLISAGLFYYLMLFSPEEETNGIITEQPTEPILPADVDEDKSESDLSITQPEVTPIPPPTQMVPSAPVRPSTTPTITGTLPDTIRVVLHAFGGKLEPVRVTSDINNVRSPYWIETAEAMRFEFLDSITIEGQISRVAIWVNGHHFNDLMEFATGGRIIELTREALSQYAELFATQGDETSQTIDQPIIINDRPLF